MAFISFEFYIFLIILIAVYYVLPVKYRWYSLLIGSMAFYWQVSEQSVPEMAMFLSELLCCWLLTLLMSKNGKYRNLLLICNLLIIGLPLLAIKEIVVAEKLLNMTKPEWWIVPLGVSFYSMQLIAYSVDVFKGKCNAEKNPLKFILFASFFPQIIQGPIPRYEQLSKELFKENRFDESKFVKGFMLILWGFFLKLCIADKAVIIVNNVFDNYPTYKGGYVIIAAILYSFQLYADFMACTSFAQGIAGMFGIEIIDNFMRPYFSTSIKEFWRRWHISLSSWLRDYIYIPLGGNKKGKVRKYINLLITFAVSGMWHGAGIKFLFWGLLHGFYLVLGEVLEPLKKLIDKLLNLDKHPKLLIRCRMFLTYIFVTIAWVIFRADSFKTGLSMLKSVFTVRNPWILTNDAIFELGLGWKEILILIICLFVLLIISKKQENGIDICGKILDCNLVTRWIIYVGAIVFIMIFGTYGYGYDAQAFIYGGF